MHLRVRSKLILYICIPLVITYALMLTWDYSVQRQQSQAYMQRLVLGRANLTVGILDARLNQAELLANSIADLISQRQDRLDPILRMRILGTLRQFEWASAVVVALDPDTQPAVRSIVVRRAVGGPTMSDLPANLNYNSSASPWFWDVKTSGEAKWFQPAQVAGILPFPTLAYSVPLIGDDKFRGVVTVHVAPTIFRLGRGPRPQALTDAASQPVPSQLFDLSNEQYIVAMRNGDVIYHVPESARVPASLSQPSMAPVATIVQDALRSASGNRGEIIPFHVGHEKVFTFEPDEDYWLAAVPIRGGEYVFLTGFPQSELMAPVNQAIMQRVAFLSIGLLALLAIVLWAAGHISKPIEKLELATQAVARGDLSVRVPEPGGHDEIATLSSLFNRMLQQLNAQMQQIRQEADARARVEGELQLARQIQTGLLPKHRPEGQFELHATNLPANHVAGDFYDYFLDPNGQLVLVIADVAGHGVAASLMSAVTRTLIRNLASRPLSLAQMARLTNDTLFQDNPGGMFVTLALCRYDPASGSLKYLTAGHPSPVVVKPDGHVTCDNGSSTAPLLGAFTFPETEFTERQLTLHIGDTLLLYTDGVTEARRHTGEFLGIDGLRDVLRHPIRPLETLEQDIIRTVQQFQDAPIADDITLLLLRRT